MPPDLDRELINTLLDGLPMSRYYQNVRTPPAFDRFARRRERHRQRESQ